MWKHKNFINLQLCAGETWVLNEYPPLDDGTYVICKNTPFTSNQTKFTSISMKNGESGYEDGLYYDNEYVFYGEIREWVNSAFRTLTFDSPVTDTTLLEWLQAYGTKQSPSQPTLTFKHFFDAGTIGSGTVKFRHYSQQEPGPEFVQIPVTKTANNYSQISSLKKDKSYTVFTYDEGNPMIAGVISYNGSNWVTSSGASIYIKEQTSDSVQFINYYSSYFLLWQSGAVFEADKALDFADLDAAGITVDKQNIIAYWLCMLKGTLITLADGTKKPIEQITYDDELLVWNFYDGKFDTAKPCWIKIPQVAHEYNLCKFSNGAEVGFVGEGGSKGYHRIYNDEAKCFTHTGVTETPIGTTTFAEDMSMPTLVGQEVVKKEVKYYNIITDKHYNLFANGILTSCKLSNKYAIENMKYVDKQLITDEEEQAYFERIENIKR